VSARCNLPWLEGDPGPPRLLKQQRLQRIQTGSTEVRKVRQHSESAPLSAGRCKASQHSMAQYQVDGEADCVPTTPSTATMAARLEKGRGCRGCGPDIA
jgi:hypothetical protein